MLNETTEVVESPREESPNERAPLWRRYLVPGLGALLVVAIALAATFGALWFQARETSPEEVGDFLATQRPVVEDRATELVGLLMNYDSTNLDERSEAILPIATGSFRQQYEEILQGLGAALEEAAASSRGEILDGPDVSFRSASEAIALTRVTQTTQSSENPGGETFIYEMEITLVDTTDGGWKADRVEILSEQRS